MCDPSRPPGPVLVRPRWSVLYGVALSPLAALAVVEVTAPPNAIRLLLRGVCALIAFAGMAAWVRANRTALDMLNWCACAGETVTVRVIESRRPRGTEPSEERVVERE